MRRRQLRSLVVLIDLIALVVVTAASQPAPEVQYEVYAVRFVTIPDSPVHFLVQGADTSSKTDLAMTFWVIKGGGKIILFDSGYYREKARKVYLAKDFMRPSKVIAERKIKPEDVSDEIISHISYSAAWF